MFLKFDEKLHLADMVVVNVPMVPFVFIKIF